MATLSSAQFLVPGDHLGKQSAGTLWIGVDINAPRRRFCPCGKQGPGLPLPKLSAKDTFFQITTVAGTGHGGTVYVDPERHWEPPEC